MVPCSGTAASFTIWASSGFLLWGSCLLGPWCFRGDCSLDCYPIVSCLYRFVLACSSNKYSGTILGSNYSNTGYWGELVKILTSFLLNSQYSNLIFTKYDSDTANKRHTRHIRNLNCFTFLYCSFSGVLVNLIKFNFWRLKSCVKKEAFNWKFIKCDQ